MLAQRFNCREMTLEDLLDVVELIVECLLSGFSKRRLGNRSYLGPGETELYRSISSDSWILSKYIEINLLS